MISASLSGGKSWADGTMRSKNLQMKKYSQVFNYDNNAVLVNFF